MRLSSVVAAVLASLVLLALPSSYAAFNGKTTTAAGFAAAATFPTYPAQVTSAGPAYYHRSDDTPAYATTTAADSSGNGQLGTYPGATDGPAAYYPFDDGSGTKAADAAGGANQLTLMNGPTWAGGHVGTGALNLDGTDDYAISAKSAVDTSNSFSVSAWVNLTNVGGNRTVVGQDGVNASAFYLQVYYGRWAIASYNSDSTNDTVIRAVSAAPPSANRWTHLAAVYDDPNDRLRLYLDGQLVATAAKTLDWRSSGGLTVGAGLFLANGRVDYVQGQIDDVRAFPRALSSGEITQIYARPRTWWTFDSPTAGQPDASQSGNTGTISGTPTYSGSGVVMDGDDYVTGAGGGIHTDRSYSVAAWVSPLDTSGLKTIAAKFGTTASSFALKSTSGVWTFATTASDSTSPTTTTVSATTPATGSTPAYVVGVYASVANELRIYVNGKLEGITAAGPVWDASGVLNVGRLRVNGSNVNDFFTGRIDDVQAFDRPLTSDDVYALYTAPAAAYMFDENYPTVAADSTGSGDTLTSAAGTTTWTASGHRGGALALSSSAYLSTSGSVLDTSNSFSVAAWVYLTTAGATNQTVLSQSGTSTSAFELQYRGSGGIWAFAGQPTDSTAAANVAVSSAASAGRWVHLVGVYDDPNDTVTLYVNGSSAGSAAATADFASSGPLVLGADKVGGTIGRFFTGSVDQVFAFPKVLSAADVASLYNQDPVLRWSLDENTGTGATDRSASVNTGTLANGPSWSTGVSGSALTFDGIDDQVTSTAAPVNSAATFSVSAWLYVTGGNAAQAAVSGNGATSFRWRLGITGNRWVFRMTPADSGNPTLVDALGPTAATNTWTHVVGTYNATTMVLSVYVNGVFGGSNTLTANWNATAPMVLGYVLNNNTQSSRWTGSIDEVNVFPRMLTLPEINALYGLYSIQPAATTIHLPAVSLGVPGALQGAQQGQTASTAVAFSGAGGAYNARSFTSPNPFTIELWFRVTGNAGGTLAGFTTDLTSMSTTADRLLYLNSTGKLVFGVAPGGTKTTVATTASYNDGVWHHAVASLGAAGMKLYTDGALQASNTGVTTALAATGYFRWAAVNLTGWTGRPANDYLTGSIDELAVYATQLTDNAVARHYAADH